LPRRTGSSSPAPLRAGSRRLYLVTPVRPDFAAFLEAAIRGGVDVVQVRERSLTDARLLDALAEVRALTAVHGVSFGVNDRPDLAVLAEADFVHVGQDDIPVAAARAFGLPVGLSTHSPHEIDEAASDNIADVVEAGATRVAVVRAIVQADDPERAASELRTALPG
jgi:thiamine-phosphate pyrophosphorylase